MEKIEFKKNNLDKAFKKLEKGEYKNKDLILDFLNLKLNKLINS